MTRELPQQTLPEVVGGKILTNLADLNHRVGSREGTKLEVDRLLQGAKVHTLDHLPVLDDAPGITIGWCTAGHTDNQFTESLAGSLLYDSFNGGPRRIWSTISVEGGPRIVETRSQIVEAFLNERKLNHPLHNRATDWLMMIDSDMSWEGDAIHRLATFAEMGGPDGEPIHLIGGLAFAGGRTKMTPTVYRSYLDEEGTSLVEPVMDYPKDSLLKVGATGAAFMLIHRVLLIDMFRAYEFLGDGSKNPHPWFVEGRRAGKQFGEDIAFCLRANSIGYPTWVHTGVKTGHWKRSSLSEDVYEELRTNDNNR